MKVSVLLHFQKLTYVVLVTMIHLFLFFYEAKPLLTKEFR